MYFTQPLQQRDTAKKKQQQQQQHSKNKIHSILIQQNGLQPSKCNFLQMGQERLPNSLLEWRPASGMDRKGRWHTKKKGCLWETPLKRYNGRMGSHYWYTNRISDDGDDYDDDDDDDDDDGRRWRIKIDDKSKNTVFKPVTARFFRLSSRKQQ